MNVKDHIEDDLFEASFEMEHGLSESESTDDDSEYDDENPKSSTKANKLQKKRLRQYIQEPKISIEQSHFNVLWKKLSDELNSLGPPTFTASQWHLIMRQKISQKYKQKQKRVKYTAGPSYQVGQDVHSSDPVHKINLPSQGTVDCYPILDKLNVLIEKEDAILKALERGNNFMKELCQSFKK